MKANVSGCFFLNTVYISIYTVVFCSCIHGDITRHSTCICHKLGWSIA